jgi:hypothetical protein
MEEILDSEIEIIKSDYYKCDECQALEAWYKFIISIKN